MTLIAALLKNYVAAFLVGIGVGAMFGAVGKLIKGASNAWD